MKGIVALLVHNDEQPFDELQARLKELNISSLHLRTFIEVKYFLKRLRHPALIFTDATSPPARRVNSETGRKQCKQQKQKNGYGRTIGFQ